MQPDGLAIVDAKVLSLTLTGEHAGTGHGPGIYAAVVMPRYMDCLVNLVQLPEHVLAKQGARLEQAVEYIHTLDLVHMDIKVNWEWWCQGTPYVGTCSQVHVQVALALYSAPAIGHFVHILQLVCCFDCHWQGANILVDAAGQWALADFGGVVTVGSPIKEVTQQFAPLPQLLGKPAKKQYDWHMLAVALAVELYPDTWREQLLENDAQCGMYAPMHKLEAAIQAASCPALVELFGRILGKCYESTPSAVSQQQ